MKNINAPLLANWIATTSNFDVLKMFRDGIAASITNLPQELIESIPAAVGDVESLLGNFNFRSIMGWVESIGDLSQCLSDGKATEPVITTVSLYKLILSRFPQAQVAAQEPAIPSASETISQEISPCTPTDKSTSTTGQLPKPSQPLQSFSLDLPPSDQTLPLATETLEPLQSSPAT